MPTSQATTPSHNQLDTKAQAWSALFSEPMSDLVKRYTSSVFFDKRLWQADIAGSLAHADMLAAQGIISASDHASIQRGMAQITSEIESGAFEWKLDLEDVHLNIEARLTQLVGDAGKRLHTGRSRNDQVATDVRLWLRGEIDLIADLLKELQVSLVDVAEHNVEVILPGFTHLQVAQPVSFGHHLLAYVEMFKRDAERMRDVRKRVNVLPLGSAAPARYCTRVLQRCKRFFCWQASISHSRLAGSTTAVTRASCNSQSTRLGAMKATAIAASTSTSSTVRPITLAVQASNT